jgi:hypothetical protein
MAVTSMANSSMRDFTKYNNMSTVFGVSPFPVDYLIYGGGGGGTGGRSGSRTGGGGASGVARYGTVSIASGVHQLTVGAGGAGSGQAPSNPGSTSYFYSLFATGGETFDNDSATGGSNDDFTGGTGTGADSGGGAGASADGENGGTGGDGFTSSITGSAVTRGGGGGSKTSDSLGGSGGGGQGGNPGVNGTVNTGSGGGGAGSSSTGGSGGSGVVIFALPLQAPLAVFSAGVTQTSAVVGINKVYTVTAAGPTDTVTIG